MWPSHFPKCFAVTRGKLCGLQRVYISAIRNVMDEERLLCQFPDPAQILRKVINEVCVKLQSPVYKPHVSIQKISGGTKNPLWQAKLTLSWPEEITVEGTGKKKADAEKIACLLACQKIKELGKLDDSNRPILPDIDVKFKNTNLKQAKSTLVNIFAMVSNEMESEAYKPIFSTAPVKDKYGMHGWRSEVTVHWPEKFTAQAVGGKKTQAEATAAMKVVHWLQQKQLLDRNNYPVLYSKKEKTELFNSRWAPYPISIPTELQEKIKHVVNEYKELEPDISKLQNMSANPLSYSPLDADNSLSEIDFFEEEGSNHQPLSDSSDSLTDVITGRPYKEIDKAKLASRSHSMYCSFFERKESQNPFHLKIKEMQRNLPIAQQREEILQLIKDNQVVVLSGETGCGKTTQVPQYIFDEYISQLKGAQCNMVVTQPRRISAISISERVAQERGEELGENIGFQVRLKKELPREKGAVLFCSTGVLLQRLQSNPNLEGISHVIVDEVHERDIQTDFLLVLLKNLILKDSKVKILLMSASMNAEMFSQYFHNCPIINVPGIIYPVREYFLSDILKFVSAREEFLNTPQVNYNLIIKLIKYIDSNKPSGAILCFLPGWQEIKAVMQKLTESYGHSRYQVIPVHSRLPAHEQKLMFEAPPPGVRKIVLATNIAETSITINDVVYVVNPGSHREMTYDAERGTATLATNWISRANARQRKGRAGRVQPGECYHLFTEDTLSKMNEYPAPEMHRVPLEKIVLDCKLYCKDIPVQEFLSKAPQPPSQEAILNAISYLKATGILDEQEKLTMLGKHIVHFTTHPSLSKALVYGTFLRCVDPMLTTAAALTANRDPFTLGMEEKAKIKDIKKAYGASTFSDHFALSRIYNEWLSEHYEGRAEERNFCNSNSLSYNAMLFMKGLKSVFGNHLYSAQMVDHFENLEDLGHTVNSNSNNPVMVLSALCAALYPNLLKMISGVMDRGRIKKHEVRTLTLAGQSATIQKESVVSKETVLPSPWLVYFYGVRSAERRQLLVRDASVIPALSLILFAGQELDIQTVWNTTSNSDDVVLMIDGKNKIAFSCSQQEADLLLELRKCLDSLFQCFLSCPRKMVFHEEYSNVESLRSKAFSVINSLLRTSQKQFAPHSRTIEKPLQRNQCSG